MSPDSTPTEVFADVEPDPDAILAEFDVESPDDLGDGAHDPCPNATVAADDTTAAELFADLQNVTPAGAESSVSDADTPDRTDGAADPVDDLAFEFVGDSDVVVRDDGDVIDSAAADLDAVSASAGPADEATPSGTALEAGDATGSAADTETDGSARRLTVHDDGTELELSGPEPTPTRIDDDAFGIAADSGR